MACLVFHICVHFSVDSGRRKSYPEIGPAFRPFSAGSATASATTGSIHTGSAVGPGITGGFHIGSVLAFAMTGSFHTDQFRHRRLPDRWRSMGDPVSRRSDSISQEGHMSILPSHAEMQRAVGHANGLNRIAIVIPCHRVVNKGGKLGGYGGGLWRKQRLLELEQGEIRLRLS